jgi:hypothetical protein
MINTTLASKVDTSTTSQNDITVQIKEPLPPPQSPLSKDEDTIDCVIKEDTFILDNKHPVRLQLFKQRLQIHKQNNKNNINLLISDIAGCLIAIQKKNPKNSSACLTIYAYPVKKRIDDKYADRKRITLELFYNKADNQFDQNLAFINEWHKSIQSLIKKSWMDSSSDDNELIKPFLIFVNPHSGAGRAKNLYYERIKPVLAEANCPHHIIMTSKHFYNLRYSL